MNSLTAISYFMYLALPLNSILDLIWNLALVLTLDFTLELAFIYLMI